MGILQRHIIHLRLRIKVTDKDFRHKRTGQITDVTVPFFIAPAYLFFTEEI